MDQRHVGRFNAFDKDQDGFITFEECTPGAALTRFSLAEILVLAGTAGAGRMTPPAISRISAAMNCV